MSTDFLNRRMDLHHTSSYENHLTMDTSYPVKLAGKVMKLFTASSDFNTNKWILENSDKEVILTVESDNVYDFAGRVIKDNVGITKAYTTNKDVFKQDDYVMVIIDFDNKKILLCSESNFRNFITGEDISSITSNIRMYTIDGDTEIPGFDYPIDTEIFDTAAEYEAEVDRYALVRSDIDKVVYEAPNNQNGSRDMTPVANVDTLNINSLNVSIQNLVFPFVDVAGIGNAGFENICSIHSYNTINGSVNDEFINKFCFTQSELLDTGLLKAEKCNKEYNNIIGDKSSYYYVLTSQNGEDKFYGDEFDLSMVFTPINISNNKFSIFYDFANNGIVVGDKSIGIALRGHSPHLIGTYWGWDNQNGFYAYNFISRGDDETTKYKTILIDGFIDDIYAEQCPYDLYIEKNRNISDMGKATVIRRTGDSWKTNTINSEELKYVKRFIEFFTVDSDYYNQISKRILRLENDTLDDYPVFCYDYLEQYTTEAGEVKDRLKFYDTTPKNIVVMYPEVFEKVLFDTTGDSFTYENEKITNFTSFHNDAISDENFERKKYKANHYMLNDDDSTEYLLYELFDRNLTSGYLVNKVGEIKTQGIDYIDGSYNKLKFISSVPAIGDDGSHQFITRYKKDDKYIDVLVNIITKVNMTNLNNPYDSEKDYNVAQIGVQDILITKEIKFANQYIRYDNNEYKFYPNGFESEGYVLYIVRNYGSTIDNQKLEMVKLSTSHFKNDNNICSGVTGMMYLYCNYSAIHRIMKIKYYYKDGDTSGTNGISTFDYFTISKIINTDAVYTTENVELAPMFTRAYLNYYMYEVAKDYTDTGLNKAIENINGLIDNESDLSISNVRNIILQTIKAYKLYPMRVNNDESHNVFYETVQCGDINSYKIAKDYKRFYAASINNKNINNGTGFRLRDLIDETYTISENALAPHASNTKKDEIFIYNIKTYNDYIKSKYVEEVFYTEEFPYLNGVGIREEYYKGKTLYEFYLYILTRNLAIPMSDAKSLLTNSRFNSDNRLFYTKDEVKKIANVSHEYNASDNKYHDYFVDTNNEHISISSEISLHNNINMSSLFGLNKSDLVDKDGNDVNEIYSSEDVILINKEQTGIKTVYSITISDRDPMIPVLLSINGTMDNIEVDKLTWESLLLALHNNKTIDILSKSLIQIKTELNDYIRLAGQNINDMISIEDNITDEDANKHDTIYDINDSDDEATKEFKRKYYKEHNAEFDEKHNLYKFNFGYGFNIVGKINKRELNNRGVIVFVSDGAETRCESNGLNPKSFDYDFTEGKIYPKRMFISKNGIICTKDYYDAENNDDPSGGGSGSDIMTFNKIINIINEMQNHYNEEISEISQYIFNNVKKQINFNTVVLDQIESSTGKRREVFMYMLSDTNDDNLTYTNTCKYKVSKSGNKLVVDNTSGEEHEFIAGEALINGIPYIFAPNGVLECGFQTVGSDSGILKVGNIPISDKRYFYDYTTGNIKLGWVEKNGCKYYCTLLDGKLTTQYRTFGNGTSKHTYWFDEYGIATEVEGIPVDIQYQINSLQEQIDNLKIATSDVYTHLTSTIYEYNEMILAVLSIKLSDEASISALSKDNLDFKRKKFSTANEIGKDIYTYNNYVYNTTTFTAGFDEGYYNRLDAKNDSIYDSTTNDELVSNIKSYNTEFINYLHSVGWINDKSSAESVNAKISMT